MQFSKFCEILFFRMNWSRFILLNLLPFVVLANDKTSHLKRDVGYAEGDKNEELQVPETRDRTILGHNHVFSGRRFHIPIRRPPPRPFPKMRPPIKKKPYSPGFKLGKSHNSGRRWYIPNRRPTLRPFPQLKPPIKKNPYLPVLATKKPAEKTTEKHVKKTTEKPAEETTEMPAEETTEKPAEKTPKNPENGNADSDEETTAKPVEETTEKPVEETTEKPAEEITEKSAEETTEKSAEETTEKSIEETTEKPVGKTTEKPKSSEDSPDRVSDSENDRNLNSNLRRDQLKDMIYKKRNFKGKCRSKSKSKPITVKQNMDLKQSKDLKDRSQHAEGGEMRDDGQSTIFQKVGAPLPSNSVRGIYKYSNEAIEPDGHSVNVNIYFGEKSFKVLATKS